MSYHEPQISAVPLVAIAALSAIVIDDFVAGLFWPAFVVILLVLIVGFSFITSRR